MRNNPYSWHPVGRENVLAVCLMAGILTAFSYWLQGDIGINLADEGLLWYGAWRTVLGEVPIRDFTAYFPGRYYWAASWSYLFGDGILGLRASVAVFQALGLTFGLLVLRRLIRSWWLLAIAASLLLMWMYPRYKVFEHTTSLAAVYFAVLLFEKPSLRRHFAAGVFLGLAIFFGLNHGLYCSVSFFFLILLNWLKTGRRHLGKNFAFLGLGILVGSVPLLFMIIAAPGFLDSVIEDRFIELFTRLSETGHINLALPVPWPWAIDLVSTHGKAMISSISLGLFFVILPLFYLASGGYLIWKKEYSGKTAIIAGSVLVGIPYLHHAFSRADLPHLAQAIQAFLIGVIALPFVVERARIRMIVWVAVACVFVMSLFTVGMNSPYFERTFIFPNGFKEMNIRGDHLWVRRHNAQILEAVTGAVRERIGPQTGLLITGYWHAFYPILGRKSPVKNFSLILPETEEKQRQQISDLRESGVGWVILSEAAIDNRDDLRFRNTHPLLWEYFMRHFEKIPIKGLPKDYWFMRRREV